jgi:hypothetical protein
MDRAYRGWAVRCNLESARLEGSELLEQRKLLSKDGHRCNMHGTLLRVVWSPEEERFYALCCREGAEEAM